VIISALCFVAGILCVQQFSELPNLLWLGIFLFLSIFFAVLRYYRILFFICGVVWAVTFATQRLAERLPMALESIEIPVIGVIDNLPDYNQRVVHFDFKVTEPVAKLPSKIRMSWYYPDQDIKAGQVWKFTIKLKRPHGSLNPGGFDYEQYLFSQAIGATGYIITNPRPQLLVKASVWLSIAVWRQKISDLLNAKLADNPSLGLIKALTIGDGSGISKAEWEVFRKTGTTHLVVISGSHVGLVAGLAYILVLKLWARFAFINWSPQSVAACAAMLVGGIYAGLAGFSVPTQRAVVMLIVWMLAIIFQRNTKAFNTLSIALFAVLIYEPTSVLSVGFWLSFLAVSLIVYVLANRLNKSVYWLEMLKINAATSIGLAPLLLIFFQQISLISPIANFIAVPLISFISVPFALIAILLLAINPVIAEPFFFITDYSLQGLKIVLVYLADFAYATYDYVQPELWSLLFSIPAVILLLSPKGLPYRYMSGLLFMPLLLNPPTRPIEGTVKLTVLDVGQALAIVVQTHNHSLIFDTGTKYSADSDSGKSVVIPFLRHENITVVDKLMISHADKDHIGGAVSILNGLPVNEVSTSAMTELQDYHPTKCTAGQVWSWDNVEFKVLGPQREYTSDNNNACVLKIRTAIAKYLLPSDIEGVAEADLTQRYGAELKADVLIAPHHGSKTSSTVAFLNAVNPQFVLISSGYLNQFKHPHPDVLNRYSMNNINWFDTAKEGALTLTEDKGKFYIASMRNTAAKYWNNK